MRLCMIYLHDFFHMLHNLIVCCYKTKIQIIYALRVVIILFYSAKLTFREVYKI
jgi:hypothetical protein